MQERKREGRAQAQRVHERSAGQLRRSAEIRPQSQIPLRHPAVQDIYPAREQGCRAGRRGDRGLRDRRHGGSESFCGQSGRDEGRAGAVHGKGTQPVPQGADPEQAGQKCQQVY